LDDFVSRGERRRHSAEKVAAGNTTYSTRE
jgi:hypothetical protein